MSNVVIVGNGPAGVSASLYTVRAGIKTLIIGKDCGALTKSEGIENYYGFTNPIKGVDLIEQGIMQAKNLGVEYVKDEVVGIYYKKGLVVKTTQGEYDADYLIIATGAKRNTLNVDGLEEFEGKGISYCAICDAFFYKEKEVCVIGDKEYALNECEELLKVTSLVTLITNGNNTNINDDRIRIVNKKIKRFSGNASLEEVILEDDTSIKAKGAFIALGSASGNDLANKLGILCENNKISVNEKMQTNIPNVYAVGDCVGGVYQIAKAVHDGMIAGLNIIKDIKK